MNFAEQIEVLEHRIDELSGFKERFIMEAQLNGMLLGQNSDLKRELADQVKQIKQQHNTIEHLRDDRHKKQEIIDVLRHDLLKQRDKIIDLKQELTEKDVQIEKLKDTSLSFMIETAEMRAIIAQRNTLIDEMKYELNTPDNFWDVVSQKDETIKQQKTAIDELNNTIEALDAEISVRKDGSKMLMKIVGVMRLWHNNETGSANAIIMINDILEHTDYGKLLEE